MCFNWYWRNSQLKCNCITLTLSCFQFKVIYWHSINVSQDATIDISYKVQSISALIICKAVKVATVWKCYKQAALDITSSFDNHSSFYRMSLSKKWLVCLDYFIYRVLTSKIRLYLIMLLTELIKHGYRKYLIWGSSLVLLQLCRLLV